MLYATLTNDMALCVSVSPVAPTASARPSEYALAGSWQLAQLYRPVTDKRGSKNKRRPRATLAADMGLSGGTAGVGNPRGRCHSYTEASAGAVAGVGPPASARTVAARWVAVALVAGVDLAAMAAATAERAVPQMPRIRSLLANRAGGSRSIPTRRSAFACQRCGLSGDGRALLHPLVQLADRICIRGR